MNALYLCFLGVSRTVQCLVRLLFLSPRHSSPRCFFNIFPASSPFRVTRLRFSTLKSCFNADKRSHCMLAVKLSPLRRAVILHPCWQQTSPENDVIVRYFPCRITAFQLLRFLLCTTICTFVLNFLICL